MKTGHFLPLSIVSFLVLVPSLNADCDTGTQFILATCTCVKAQVEIMECGGDGFGCEDGAGPFKWCPGMDCGFFQSSPDCPGPAVRPAHVSQIDQKDRALQAKASDSSREGGSRCASSGSLEKWVSEHPLSARRLSAGRSAAGA
jgi:hypothetical protein